MAEKDIQSAILKRLNVLIALQLEMGQEAGKKSITEKVRKLSELGLTSREMADILGKPVNYITACLSSIRGSKKG